MIQRTLILLKPDAVKRGLIGTVITRFEQAGLKVAGMKMVWVDSEFSRKHYEPHVEKGFYSSLEEFITEGPVVAMVVEGVSSIEVVRKIVGSTEPKEALPGTIRGDFAHHSYNYADTNNKAIMNLIHASDAPETAKKEVALWFSDKELHSYKVNNENHTF
ncbi:nucleoside-diphosphate kinase [archaeon]|jgi:nucleoside-diphosphate kinase|nr:nucleoside-diphosphate kinase [archaeon]MBT4646907.1 nucleoside-diphosphate kinase [archaeon]MBT6820895.1 nucleoside-diphosphate kinase [archaeon]MBT7392918.1 nucleoside-diphosphate kinase [archaeon]